MNHILLSRALLLTGSCLLLATTWCHGQAWRYQMLTQDTSYAAICTMADDYFQTHTEHQANNDHGYKDYWRFRWFWRDRYDDQKGYLRLGERHTEAIQLNEYCTANSQLESDWVSIGPNQIPQATGAMIANSATSCGLSVAGQSALSQGMLESVLAMDSTGQVIFAGSNSGGLFKTTNGGTTWANVTEAQKFPGMGIHRIIRDPNNAQRLWIATGNTSF
ncbi:MAG: WD40/YVTN/BNR-like repeat-containing protein [Salibacteraceae bacterium]